MTLFKKQTHFKQQTHSEAMRKKALMSSLRVILGYIDTVAGNGHFSYNIDIKKDLTSSGLSRDIVDTMKIELEKMGYKITIVEDRFQIKW